MSAKGLATKFHAVVVAVGLGIGLPTQAGVINFGIDTGEMLAGTFSLSGFDLVNAYPSAFQLLPGGAAYQGLDGFRDPGYDEVAVITLFPGAPGETIRVLGIPSSSTDFAPYGGYYTNSGQDDEGGTLVNFLFWNLHETGGDDGTFTGAFCFSTSPIGQNACPTSSVPSPAPAALLGVGLIGLAAARRRRQ